MFRQALLLALLCLSQTAFAAKNYGYLRVATNTPIYHGADLNAAVEATARKGQVFALLADGPIHGFYKIDYSDHVSYIAAGDVWILDEDGTPVPTAAPTKAATPGKPGKTVTPSKSPTKTEDEESDDEDEPKVSPTPQAKKSITPKAEWTKGRGGDEEEEEPRVTPTPSTGSGQAHPTEDPTERPTLRPTRVPTVEPTEEATELPTRLPTRVPTVEPTEEPTERPTLVPTRIPTRVPTLEPTEEPTERPTLVPTRIPTRVPTLEPTEEPTERPTLVPTRIPTRVPTLEPTEEPTERPTLVPTRIPTERPWPTAVPTAVPTEKPWPTAIPTRIPTERPWPTAVPVPTGPTRARGRRNAPANTTVTTSRSRSSRVNLGSTLQFGGKVASNVRIERPAGKLNDLELHLPLGWGKHEALVQPPFKQNAGVNDQRAIEFAGFAGLGLELRTARWLRWDFDWIGYSHRTKAADLSIPALKVNVPGAPPTTLFDESEAYYRMNAHEFRLGVKASAPLGSVVEPWVSASYGAWVWTAELADLNREIIYGEDSGVAFGGSVGLGVDFHGDFSNGMGWTVTPFVEWGAPQVNPQFKDVAGLGVDWKDDFGTPVAIPARAGIQFGIGF